MAPSPQTETVFVAGMLDGDPGNDGPYDWHKKSEDTLGSGGDRPAKAEIWLTARQRCGERILITAHVLPRSKTPDCSSNSTCGAHGSRKARRLDSESIKLSNEKECQRRDNGPAGNRADPGEDDVADFAPENAFGRHSDSNQRANTDMGGTHR